MRRARRSGLAGAEPLSPRKKWRAITLATLVVAPAFWSVLAGVVAVGSDDPQAPAPAPLIAFGLALVPFVFIVLAFLSEHPRAPGAVVRAMVLSLLVGIPIAAVAPDAVTGFVAGLGAGGIAALRADPIHTWKARAAAVAVVTLFVFLLVMVSDVALLLAPALPFTSIGVADQIVERRRWRPGATRT
ncbi:MAG TPA: hypothetical protein VGZ51_06510 [Actinomycetota bacterium]|nr:hypothetical protein [Actinomycetota bacterium]